MAAGNTTTSKHQDYQAFPLHCRPFERWCPLQGVSITPRCSFCFLPGGSVSSQGSLFHLFCTLPKLRHQSLCWCTFFPVGDVRLFLATFQEFKVMSPPYIFVFETNLNFTLRCITPTLSRQFPACLMQIPHIQPDIPLNANSYLCPSVPLSRVLVTQSESWGP